MGNRVMVMCVMCHEYEIQDNLIPYCPNPRCSGIYKAHHQCFRNLLPGLRQHLICRFCQTLIYQE
jgi:hypothetical protein